MFTCVPPLSLTDALPIWGGRAGGVGEPSERLRAAQNRHRLEDGRRGAGAGQRGTQRLCPLAQLQVSGFGEGAYPVLEGGGVPAVDPGDPRSEEHTSEPQSLMRTSYPVVCLKKQNH